MPDEEECKCKPRRRLGWWEGVVILLVVDTVASVIVSAVKR